MTALKEAILYELNEAKQKLYNNPVCNRQALLHIESAERLVETHVII